MAVASVAKMLTPKQFEAVGRLALAFNEIEWAFEVYMAHLLGAPEWGASVLFAREGTFRHKAKRFDRLLEALGEGRPVLEAEISPIRQWVKKAGELAEKRNEFVHALVVHDFKTNNTYLRVKGVDIDCSADEINSLAAEAAVLVNQMHTQCGELLVSVDAVRSQEKEAQEPSVETPCLDPVESDEDSEPEF